MVKLNENSFHSPLKPPPHRITIARVAYEQKKALTKTFNPCTEARVFYIYLSARNAAFCSKRM